MAASLVASNIDKATSEILLMPDWDENLRLCDFASASLPAANEVIKHLTKRLQGTKNPKVVQLGLTLADTLVKNGSIAVIQAVAANTDFLNLLASIATNSGPGRGFGSEAQTAAASLIQLLGMAFVSPAEKSLGFVTLYERLKSNGVLFPPEDHSAVSSLKPAPIPSPYSRPQPQPQPQSAAAAAPAPAPIPAAHHPPHPPAPAAVAVDPRVVEEQLGRALVKLKGDLSGVRKAVAHGARMLSEAGGAAANPANGAFLDCVDFLYQAKYRLQDLTEGCISGVITDETVFETVLSCTEAVSRVLEASLPIAALSHPSKAREREAFAPRPHPEVADLCSFDEARAVAAAASASSAAPGGSRGGSRPSSAPSGPGQAAPPPPSSASRAAPAPSRAAAENDLLGLFPSSSSAAAAPSSAAAAPITSAAAAAAPAPRSQAAGAALTSGPSFSLASFEPVAVGGVSSSAAAAANPFDSLSETSSRDSAGAAHSSPAPTSASAAPLSRPLVSAGAGASADPFATLGSAAAAVGPRPAAASLSAAAGETVLGGDSDEEDPFATFSGSHSARTGTGQAQAAVPGQGKPQSQHHSSSASSVLRDLDDVLR